MKNTLVPLTIVFFDRSGKRVRKLSMTPCRTDPCAIYNPGRRVPLRARAAGVRHARGRKLGPALGAQTSRCSRAGLSQHWCTRSFSLMLRRGARRRAMRLLGEQRPRRRHRSGPRPPCELDDRADRPGLIDAEDQGLAAARTASSAGSARRTSTCASRSACRTLLEHAGDDGRHDADEDGRHEHRQRRARADRESVRAPRSSSASMRTARPIRRLAARTRSTRRSGRGGRTTSTPEQAGGPRRDRPG